MTKRSLHALLFVLALAAGCGQSLRSATADQIHCAPADTIIENSHSEMDRELWIARCGGQRTEYACSQDKSGDGQIQCAKTDPSQTSL